MTTGDGTGPRSELSGPITAGRRIEPISAVRMDLAQAHYVTEEFFASGTATAFNTSAPLEADGMWSVTPDESAPYRTRFVVRRPSDPSRFNGTVLVEWFNVSGGVEAGPDWTYTSPLIVRDGYAYVGVSVQAFGVDGGTPLVGVPGMERGRGLVVAEPKRYGELRHPGDRFSFDMFTQIGRALRTGVDPSALGPLRPRHVVAMGESQSAFFLTTYVNALHGGAQAYDGFLVHSRGSSAASMSGTPIASPEVPPGVRIRPDSPVPVFVFETETDLGPLLDFGPARQPDTDHVRTWEVAGTAHGDAYLVGAFASALGCDFTINDGPHRYVVQAALAALNRWVTDGVAPPGASPLTMSSTAPPVFARDDLGIALGGVRTPAVDVPVATLSGESPAGASRLCSLFGSTVPFDAGTLARLYGDRDGYLAAYETNLAMTISAGFLLESDRADLLAQAQGVLFPS